MSPSLLSAAIVENMAEFRPGLCTEAAQQGLMQWLLKRVKVRLILTHSLTHTGQSRCAKGILILQTIIILVLEEIHCSISYTSM